MLLLFISLTLTVLWGGGLIINKGIFQLGNFIHLLTLLSLWLVVYRAIVNKCLHGVYSVLNVLVYSSAIIAIKTKSLLIFFIFYEYRIIPITLIVFLYGYQPEKLQAASTLLLYTVVRSFPLLIILLKGEITMTNTAFMSIPITMRFLIKTPIYLFHTWLPKAHVEAPIGGSIVLAGVLLKLGSYGLLLFIPLVKMNILIPFYYALRIVGPIIRSLICLRQRDMKLLIAYSSVVHMSVVTLGLFRGSELGQSCGLIIVLGHGLSSPILFAYAFWFYEYSHSRLMVNNSRNWPLIRVGFLGLVSLNMGVPPSLRLWAEVLMRIRVIRIMGWAIPAMLLIFFLGVAYNLYMYTSCFHSKFNNTSYSINTIQLLPACQTIFMGYGAFLCLDLFHLYLDIIHLISPSIYTYK